jgi:HCOMODA/2-hydroxy-3-carboxy-muconic semialdehyde decarboxylase
VAVWDSRDEFGDTELLVTKPAEGRSMAKALGDCWMVLLARHGATVAAHSLHECVFRSIYICRNAELQSRALAMGKLGPLSKGEIDKCAAHSLTPRTMARAWEYWARRLEKADYATGGHSPKAKPEAEPRPQPAKLISSQSEAGKKR